MTILDEILEASTDPSVPTPDLLRKVQIAAHRLGAGEVEQWVRNELSGYDDDANLPNHRVRHTSVMGKFYSFGPREMTQQLTAKPEGCESWWIVKMQQPLLELFELSEGEDDASRPWETGQVLYYEQSKVFGYEDWSLNNAWNVITRQSLKGLVDVVRSKAMEFALELQGQFPDAGSVGGPTVATAPELALSVNNFYTTVIGNGVNVANGSHAQQTSTVNKGDEEGLVAALEELGLSKGDRDEFMAAFKVEQSADGPKTKGFLSRVESGAINIGAKVSTAVAVSVLGSLVKSYLGIHS